MSPLFKATQSECLADEGCVCVRMCVCRQTECPRRHRRRGMATDVQSVCLARGGGVDKVRCMSVCVYITQGRWGRHQRDLKLND